MLRGGAGFFWDQSRWWRAAVAFASGEREGAASGCMVSFFIVIGAGASEPSRCDKLQSL